MLNPTLIDARPSGTVQNTDASMSSQNPDSITLQLRHLKDNVDRLDGALPESTGGALPLADYVIIGWRTSRRATLHSLDRRHHSQNLFVLFEAVSPGALTIAPALKYFARPPLAKHTKFQIPKNLTTFLLSALSARFICHHVCRWRLRPQGFFEQRERLERLCSIGFRSSCTGRSEQR